MTRFLAAILAILMAGAAYAARNAVVDDDGVDMLRGPRSGSGLLMKLKKGQHIVVSNYPTAGFYKVRAPDGTLGWVKSNVLELGPMPDLKGMTSPGSDDLGPAAK